MHPNLLLQIYHRQLTRYMKNSSDKRMKDLKLVSYVANSYPSDPTYIVSKLDKLQEGNLRFLQYKDRYKPEFNNEFSTFIVWPIRGGILDIMKTIDAVHIPPRQRKELLDYYRVQYGGHAKKLIVSSHRPSDTKEYWKYSTLQKQVKDTEYLKSNYKDPGEETMTNTINNLINNKLLKRLPKLQKRAIKLRFNIANYIAKKNRNTELLPYERIGAIMKMSHQHVRTLCHKALKNMKRYSLELQIEKDAYL